MSFSKIQSAGRYIFSTFRTFPRIIRALLKPGDKNILDNIIFSCYKGSSSSSHSPGIKAIETLRKSMLQSGNEIIRKEYGQGSNVLANRAPTERVSEVCRIMSKSKSECLFLYYLIKILKPGYSIELGACLGISAAYIGVALKENNNGRLVTLEGSPGRAKIAIENLESLGLGNYVSVLEGRFQDVLANHLNSIERLEFAFIDGHHDELATIGYFNQLIPKFTGGGIMVFDDIFWSAGMNRAWKRIKKSEAVKDSFEFIGMGIVTLD